MRALVHLGPHYFLTFFDLLSIQLDPESASLVQLAVNPIVTAMGVHNSPDDGQAHSGAGYGPPVAGF